MNCTHGKSEQCLLNRALDEISLSDKEICALCSLSLVALEMQANQFGDSLRQQGGQAADASNVCLDLWASKSENRVSPDSLESNPHSRLTIGNYRIVREIGRGGMGVVYEAEQLTLGRRVALKILPPSLLQSSSAARRFQREAAAASLHHTNIVPVFESGRLEDGTLYYAMQLIEGRSLNEVRDEIRRVRSQAFVTTRGGGGDAKSHSTISCDTHSPHPEDAPSPAILTTQTRVRSPDIPESTPSHDSAKATATSRNSVEPTNRLSQVLGCQQSGAAQAHYRFVAEVGRQAASALQHAHERSIIHRDVKPSNLIIDNNETVWLADFGLAKRQDEGLTRTHEAPGTLRYMSPERFSGIADARSDIYSLGASLYELLTLQPAFTSDDELSLLERIKNSQPIAPRSIDPGIPRDLQTIVLKSIAKEPRQRYPTADALKDDLRRFLEGRPILGRRVGLIERSWLWAKSEPALTTSLLVVALLCILTIVGSLWGAMYFRVQQQVQSRLAASNFRLATEREAERKRAMEKQEIATDVTDFLTRNLLTGELLRGASLDALDSISRRIHAEFLDRPETEAEIRMALGAAMLQMEQPERGLEHFHSALQIYVDLAGPADPRTEAARYHCAKTYGTLSEWEEAIQTFQWLHDKQVKRLGQGHVDTQWSAGYLGCCYLQLGRQDLGTVSVARALRVLTEEYGFADRRISVFHRSMYELCLDSGSVRTAERIQASEYLRSMHGASPEMSQVAEQIWGKALDPRSPAFDPVAAIEIADRYSQSKVQNSGFLRAMAIALVRNSRHQEAIEILSQVNNDSAWDNVCCQLIRSLAMFGLGDRQLAEESFAAGLARFTNPETQAYDSWTLLQEAGKLVYERTAIDAPDARGFVVTTLEDELDFRSDSGLSLREALWMAKDGDRIEIPIAGEIELRFGELVLDHSISIAGTSSKPTTINAEGRSRVFAIDDLDATRLAEIKLSNLKLVNGATSDFCRHERLDHRGGAIHSREALYVENCVFENNRSIRGSAIWLDPQAEATVRSSEFRSNTASAAGAIYVSGYRYPAKLRVFNCSFFGNAARNGAAITCIGATEISNSTFTENTASILGGALMVHGSRTEIACCTFVSNRGAAIASMRHHAVANVESFRIRSTLLASNSPVCLSINNELVPDVSHSLIGSYSGPFVDIGGNQLEVDPRIGPLNRNGGSTPTHALYSDSPAVDRGEAQPEPVQPTDQRGDGFSRIVASTQDGIAHMDIGAFEYNPELDKNPARAILAASAEHVTVTTLNDESNGVADGSVSLREALALVRDQGTIDFAVTGTIQLQLGQLEINRSLRIDAPGMNELTVDAAHASRVFQIERDGVNLEIQGLSLVNGLLDEYGGVGAGINFESTGKLTLIRCRIAENQCTGYHGEGAGIHVCGGAVLHIVGCRLSKNRCYEGGAIRAEDNTQLELRDSTFDENSAEIGGGISLAHQTVADLTNCTLSNNSAISIEFGGGAIFCYDASLRLTHCTVTQNRSSVLGSGIAVTGGTQVRIRNSIVYGNRLDSEGSPVDSQIAEFPDPFFLRLRSNPVVISHSVIGKSSGALALDRTCLTEDPKLGPLSDLDGSTPTHSLLAQSPAIDAGELDTSIGFDQRGSGFFRAVDGDADGKATPDIGAYEFSP